MEALSVATILAILWFIEKIGGTPMVIRPIVVSPLVGLALGDLTNGVLIGATLELVFMGAIQIGGAVPPDVLVGAGLGTAFAIMNGSGADVALTLALPISIVAQSLKVIVFIMRSWFMDFAMKQAAEANFKGLHLINFGGLVLQCLMYFAVAYVAIAVIGGLIGQVGTMVAFFTLLNLFTRPFQQIGQIANIIQSVLASGERIYSLLDEVEEAKDKEGAIDDEKDIVGQFDFEHVYFSYLIDKPLIEDFTLHVNPGDTVAIVGPTGAGKTTMVNLIMRFYDITNIANENDLNQKINSVITKVKNMYGETSSPTIDLSKGNTIQEKTAIARETLLNYLSLAKQNSTKVLSGDDAKIDNIFEEIIRNVFNNGNIRLDNKTIFNYTRKALRGSIGMVLQDTWLFTGTIKENLLYGDPNATDEEIESACKEAHIDHFIKTLPGGYNFMLTEDGENVSQGQRQLLTIARAIISKPKIMILDEATSSVDTRTEQQIQDALNRIMVGRTSFVIAHRLSTIKNAKLIIVMKKGHIIETGNHKELLAKNGFYAELYNSQFAGVNPREKESLDS